MEKLSIYVGLDEACKSPTAIKLGISTKPSEEVKNNLEKVCTLIFDKVREHFGKPIAITSGYRPKEMNKAIGGATNSQHCTGNALDIDGDVLGGVDNADIFDYIKDNLDFDQLIWEFGDKNKPDWVHVSYVSHKNRKQVLVAKKDKSGKTSYERYTL